MKSKSSNTVDVEAVTLSASTTGLHEKIELTNKGLQLLKEAERCFEQANMIPVKISLEGSAVTATDETK